MWLVSNIWNSCSRIDFVGIVKVKWSVGDFQIPDPMQAQLPSAPASRYPRIKLRTTCLRALCTEHIVVNFFEFVLLQTQLSGSLSLPSGIAKENLIQGASYIEHKNSEQFCSKYSEIKYTWRGYCYGTLW